MDSDDNITVNKDKNILNNHINHIEMNNTNIITINNNINDTNNIISKEIPPPLIKNDNINEFKTPPEQTGLVFENKSKIYPHIVTNFDLNDLSNNNYSKIQSLPTPLVYNNNSHSINKLYNDNLVNSPTLRNNKPNLDNFASIDSGNNNNNNNNNNNLGNMEYSSLRIPKTRHNRSDSNNNNKKHPIRQNLEMKNILVDKNTNNDFNITKKTDNNANNINNRYFSEYKINDSQVNSLDQGIRSPLRQVSNTSIFRNIKPVDRVVSLPFQNHNNNSNNINIVINETIPEVTNNCDELPMVIKLHSIDDPIQPQIWKVVKKIGEGSFSKVYLADDFKTAIKITDVNFNKDCIQSNELKSRIKNSLTRELEILRLLNHPNIIKLIGTDYYNDLSNNNFEHDELKISRISMAIEYCKGGDLFSFILNFRSKLSIELIRCIFANIVSAIYYMHNLNICHRDIKLENLLLKINPIDIINNGIELSKSKKPIIVLSDFGLSKKLDIDDPMLSTRCGSEDYVSPELLLGMPYDGKQNDCWSLGVVLYTILENRLPFDPLPNERENRLKRNSKPAHRIAMISWSWYLLKDENLDVEYKDAKRIVKRLLTKRNKRADINEIKNDPWCLPYIIYSDITK